MTTSVYCLGGCGYSTRQPNGYVRGHTPRPGYIGCKNVHAPIGRTYRTYSASPAVSALVALYVENLDVRQLLTAGIAASITHLIMMESDMTEAQADEWASELVTDERIRRA